METGKGQQTRYVVNGKRKSNNVFWPIEIVGRINLQSQDHIGMLIYGTFNASIPKAHIPSNRYEWRVSEEEAKPFVGNQDGEDTDKRKRSQYGEWIDKQTGDAVGGKNGIVEFDVVEWV